MSRDMCILLVISFRILPGKPAPTLAPPGRGAPGTTVRPQVSSTQGTPATPATTRSWRGAAVLALHLHLQLHPQLQPQLQPHFLQLPLPPTINFLYLHHQLPPSSTINFLQLQLPPTSTINFLHHHGLGLPCRRPQGFGLRHQLHHHSPCPQLHPQLHHHRMGGQAPCLAGLQPGVLPGEGGLQSTQGWGLTFPRGRRRWTPTSPQ